MRAVVGDHSDARSAGGLPVISKPGKNGDAGGCVAGGDGLDGLVENAGRIQAENRNLAATRAGVGDDREIIDFVDGDATRRGGRARPGGGHVAGRQRNFFGTVKSMTFEATPELLVTLS